MELHRLVSGCVPLQPEEKNDVTKRIISIIKVASKCGQSLSLKEIVLMLPQKISEQEILSFIKNDQAFTGLSVENDFFVEKGYEHLFYERNIRVKISSEYSKIAKLFANHLVKNNSDVKLAAVCGSVAYGSARASDDIDLFIIAETNRLWLVFSRALLLSRIYNLKAQILGQRIDFCLSYMQDHAAFEKESQQRKTALFARELLSIIVFYGESFYQHLLLRNRWIQSFFPKLTTKKLTDKTQSLHLKEPSSTLHDIFNLAIYASLGNYLRLKAFMRNLGYRKQQRDQDLFEAKITRGSCVYNSVRYNEIEKMYR